jgi:DNA-binding LacI/PurR family transcriptional regulator
MPVSIRDIARISGVNASTVSRVINGSTRYRISDETARRVWQVIEQQGYRVDPIARQNVRRRWHEDKPRGGIYRMAVIYPGLSNNLASQFYYDILFGVQQAILESGLALAGVYEQGALSDSRTFFQATDPLEVDGLLLINTHSAPLRARLRRRVAAAVMLNHPGGPRLDSVCFDYRQAIRTMVEHLASLGHRRIVYAGRTLCGDFPSDERTMGYMDAMRSLGLSVHEDDIIDTAGGLRDGFEKQWAQFERLRPRPTAMACSSDRVCIEMLRRFVQAGLRVPQDIAMGGYEDLDAAEFMIPRLTTIHAPRRELGAQAVRLLARRIENSKAPVEHVVLKTHLVVRESCGAAPGSRCGARD